MTDPESRFQKAAKPVEVLELAEVISAVRRLNECIGLKSSVEDVCASSRATRRPYGNLLLFVTDPCQKAGLARWRNPAPRFGATLLDDRDGAAIDYVVCARQISRCRGDKETNERGDLFGFRHPAHRYAAEPVCKVLVDLVGGCA